MNSDLLGVPLALALLSPASTAAPAIGAKKGPDPPARPEVRVAPPSVAPGQAARVQVTLIPEDGVKINRYPKIKVTVPAVKGLVDATEASVGNPSPPPLDDTESNYFKEPEPIKFELRVEPAVSRGRYEIPGKLRYFYCVAASGYCAPALAELKIPVTVR